jgi:hypothetical protein
MPMLYYVEHVEEYSTNVDQQYQYKEVTVTRERNEHWKHRQLAKNGAVY